MSWFSNLAETYDRISDIAGIPDGNGNVLLPRNFMLSKTDICITIDGSGAFRRVDASPLSIIIPCTESSEGRTSAVAPHPLHEQLGYLILDRIKRNKYLAQLATWSSYHYKVAAVYQYVENGMILDDLRREGVQVDVAEYDEQGRALSAKTIKDKQDKIKKLFIRFRVEVAGDLSPNLWEDGEIIEAWQKHCMGEEAEDEVLCYATGIVAPSAKKHQTGINPNVNSAKLVSCNDETNYTYRGRFDASDQANAISADVSHKAHAMLKYLIASHGYKCDSQAIVAWAIDDGQAMPDPFKDTLALLSDVMEVESDKLLGAHEEIASHFGRDLRNALSGRGNGKKLGNMARRVAVIALDAATTGRMGITFYQDLLENEYIERLVSWHETCCWWFHRNKRDFTSTPSVDRIIAAVYGEPHGESYNKIKKQARLRLLHHILCGEPLSRSWINAAVTRVSNPFSYGGQDGGWARGKWWNALTVVCAIELKYYNDMKEGLSLELDRTFPDRDYLFGRLLAIADRIENHARYLQNGKDDSEKRPTNAVRYMAAFVSKPLRTWNQIYSYQLSPYIQRLNGAKGYQTQIDEIMALFDPSDINDAHLGGKYLIGYSLQRRALYIKNNETDNDIVDNKEEDYNEFNQEN